MTTQLDGKVAVVTGAGSGLGRAIAQLLAERGAQVVAADILAETAAATAADLDKIGPGAFGLRVDIAEEGAVNGMIQAAKERFGRLDVLCNVAAALGEDALLQDTDAVATPPEAWRRTVDVNLTGTWLCCRAAIPVMLETDGGSIINISSTASIDPPPGIFVAYASSKAAVNHLTKHIARTYQGQPIRCNVVAPGATDTPGLWRGIGQTRPEGDRIPRVGRPVDIAEITAFLASDASVWINGQVIVVDGGASV